MTAPEASVADLERGLAPQARAAFCALRDVVRATVPQAEESLLWGSLSWHRPALGGRVKGAVCLITTKRGRVRLEFIHGASLADPRGLLRGAGVAKRHVEVRDAADARRPEVEALIRAAARHDPSRVG